MSEMSQWEISVSINRVLTNGGPCVGACSQVTRFTDLLRESVDADPMRIENVRIAES